MKFLLEVPDVSTERISRAQNGPRRTRERGNETRVIGQATPHGVTIRVRRHAAAIVYGVGAPLGMKGLSRWNRRRRPAQRQDVMWMGSNVPPKSRNPAFACMARVAPWSAAGRCSTVLRSRINGLVRGGVFHLRRFGNVRGFVCMVL